MLPAWHPHLDVWLVALLLGYGYWFVERRIRPRLAPDSSPTSRRKRLSWYGGTALLWLVSDWPLSDIGETALFTVHTVEHMVITYAVPPLLLMGIPTWLADATLGRPRVARWLRPLARPVPAFTLLNATLIAINWPNLVTWMLSSDVAHLTMHTWLAGVAFLMWLPVVSPAAALPPLRPPSRMLYLFLQTLLPTLPASFLTFSSAPLYPVYGDAALAYGLTAVVDQTVAGIVMKLGGGLLLWGTIVVIWFRWSSREREWEQLGDRVQVP